MSDDYYLDRPALRGGYPVRQPAPPVFTALERIDQAQAAAASAVDELEAVAVGCDNPEQLSFGLDLARRIKRSIGDIERQLEQAIAHSTDEPRFEVPLLGAVQVRRRTRRTGWDHEALDRAAVQAIADKERLDEQIVHAVIADYRQLLSVGAAKAAFAKATGHDLDEFCTVTPDGVSVQITTPNGTARIGD